MQHLSGSLSRATTRRTAPGMASPIGKQYNAGVVRDRPRPKGLNHDPLLGLAVLAKVLDLPGERRLDKRIVAKPEVMHN